MCEWHEYPRAGAQARALAINLGKKGRSKQAAECFWDFLEKLEEFGGLRESAEVTGLYFEASW